MGPLDGLKVKIVVAPENSSLTDKLKFAMQNNIACLKPEWVYESLKLGYALPFKNYLIKSTKACSTPEKLKGIVRLCISCIKKKKLLCIARIIILLFDNVLRSLQRPRWRV